MLPISIVCRDITALDVDGAMHEAAFVTQDVEVHEALRDVFEHRV